MAGKRAALLITTDTYVDAAFKQLDAPIHDASALARVLEDEEIGAYQVSMLMNRPSHEVRVRINKFFSSASRDDVVLLYFSGHGVKDETGRLHFVTTDTTRALVASTAVSAQFVRDLIDHSAVRRVVVWLDCCYAGAFPSGMLPKAAGDVDILEQLAAGSGRGCAVMAASTHIQYAFERGKDVSRVRRDHPSVFTNAIVEGLRTGDADTNGDGVIDAVELYDYVSDNVKKVTPSQTPSRNDQTTGEIYIARSKKGIPLHSELPADIGRNLRSNRPNFQVTAIRELAEWARSCMEHKAIAIDTLRQLCGGRYPHLVEIAEAELATLGLPIAVPCTDSSDIDSRTTIASTYNRAEYPDEISGDTSDEKLEVSPSAGVSVRDLLIAIGGVIAALVFLAILGASTVLVLPERYKEISYIEGNEPKRYDCSEGACVSFSWQLQNDSSKIISTFEPVEHTGFRGLTVDLTNDSLCHAAHIRWTVYINDSIATSGELKDSSGSMRPQHVKVDTSSDVSKITVEAHRVDAGACKTYLVVSNLELWQGGFFSWYG